MADENLNNPDSGGQTPELVQVSRADFERIQKNAERFAKLENAAKEAEMESPEEYVESLEEAILSKMREEPRPMNVTQPVQPKPVASQQPTPPAPPQPDPQLLAAQRAAFSGFMTAQKLEYEMEQSKLPEAERSGFTPKELIETINQKKGLIQELAPSHNGNIFSAANYILTITKGIQKAKQEGAQTAASQTAAMSSATLNTGTIASPATATTPEAKYKEMQKKWADEIVPDDKPYQMPT